ncbi:hypothetical protein K469DRAFT_684141 [Zopfia rhizophila CBS 207.26]|uniref:Uncharacterized protein n=1 Tax=Zopfia rhizophila CBS 207.26 TaxID=1314779 RepID=A0A6A6EAF3_9PEZI|nr:hypothetical protein K469DRAFT_684141 [Zopfia rhizophila CBS 207.26]
MVGLLLRLRRIKDMKELCCRCWNRAIIDEKAKAGAICMAGRSGHEAVVQLLHEDQDMLGQVRDLQPTSDAHPDNPQAANVPCGDPSTTGVQPIHSSIHSRIHDVPLKPFSSLNGFFPSEETCADEGGELPSDQMASDRTGMELMTPVSCTASCHHSMSCSNGHADFDRQKKPCLETKSDLELPNGEKVAPLIVHSIENISLSTSRLLASSSEKTRLDGNTLVGRRHVRVESPVLDTGRILSVIPQILGDQNAWNSGVREWVPA